MGQQRWTIRHLRHMSRGIRPQQACTLDAVWTTNNSTQSVPGQPPCSPWLPPCPKGRAAGTTPAPAQMTRAGCVTLRLPSGKGAAKLPSAHTDNMPAQHVANAHPDMQPLPPPGGASPAPLRWAPAPAGPRGCTTRGCRPRCAASGEQPTLLCRGQRERGRQLSRQPLVCTAHGIRATTRSISGRAHLAWGAVTRHGADPHEQLAFKQKYAHCLPSSTRCRLTPARKPPQVCATGAAAATT